MRRALVSCLPLAALFTALQARSDEGHTYPACTRQSTGAGITAAKGAFQAGNGSFNEADYARAIMYWEDAYRRDCSAHAMLLNLSRAYELHGNKAQAVEALRTYLQRVPESPDRDTYQRRLDALERQLHGEAPTAAPTPAAPTPPTPTPAPAGTKPAAPTAAAPTAAAVASETEAEAALAPPERPLWPLFVAGGGGLVAAIAAPIYLKNRADLSDAVEACNAQRNGCPPEIAEKGNSARIRTNVSGTVIVGGVVIAGAGVLYYFLSGNEAAPATTARFEPWVSNGLLGLGYSRSF